MAKTKKKFKKRHRTVNFTMDAAKDYLHKRVDQITPNVYAAFADVLYDDYGWESEQIEELFAKTQILWGESVADRRDMAQICFDKTGIDVRTGVEEPMEGEG